MYGLPGPVSIARTSIAVRPGCERSSIPAFRRRGGRAPRACGRTGSRPGSRGPPGRRPPARARPARVGRPMADDKPVPPRSSRSRSARHSSRNWVRGPTRAPVQEPVVEAEQGTTRSARRGRAQRRMVADPEVASKPDDAVGPATRPTYPPHPCCGPRRHARSPRGRRRLRRLRPGRPPFTTGGHTGVSGRRVVAAAPGDQHDLVSGRRRSRPRPGTRSPARRGRRTAQASGSRGRSFGAGQIGSPHPGRRRRRGRAPVGRRVTSRRSSPTAEPPVRRA